MIKKMVIILILSVMLLGVSLPINAASYCDENYCGCAEKEGYVLMSWSCVCGSNGQKHNCRYEPLAV